MAQLLTPYKEGYDCPVIRQRVTIEGMDVTHSDSIDTAQEMRDCTGNHICNKHPGPVDFMSPKPSGCPYHDNLNLRT